MTVHPPVASLRQVSDDQIHHICSHVYVADPKALGVITDEIRSTMADEDVDKGFVAYPVRKANSGRG